MGALDVVINVEAGALPPVPMNFFKFFTLLTSSISFNKRNTKVEKFKIKTNNFLQEKSDNITSFYN